MSSSLDINNFRVSGLIHEAYDDVLINMVDFKRHLKPEIALNKKTYKHPDGRPNHSKYYYGDLLIAQINYYFVIDDNNMISRRTEYLHYIDLNGELGPAIIIKDKYIDLTLPADAELAVLEREKSRHSMLASIKAVLLAVIQQYNPNLSSGECIEMGIPFWDDYLTEITHFEQLGTEEFKDALQALTLPSISYPWLSYEIDPINTPGVTLRDYMVSKLTYISTSNHPDLT